MTRSPRFAKVHVLRVGIGLIPLFILMVACAILEPLARHADRAFWRLTDWMKAP